MSRLFLAEHFETAKQFEVPGFADVWGMTSAELALTLTKLDAQDSSIRMSLEDLQGYHFLQYGEGLEVVRESAEWLVEGNDWIEKQVPVKETIEKILGDERLSVPLELGRILVEGVEVPEALAEWTDESSAPKARLGAQRPEKFVIPVVGAAATFLGRISVDLFEATNSRFSRSRWPYNEIISGLQVHSDLFNLEHSSGEHRNFAAQSHSISERTELVSIRQIQPNKTQSL